MVDFRYDGLAALRLKAVSFVIDVRFESMEALRFNGACVVINLLGVSCIMSVSCIIDLF